MSWRLESMDRPFLQQAPPIVLSRVRGKSEVLFLASNFQWCSIYVNLTPAWQTPRSVRGGTNGSSMRCVRLTYARCIAHWMDANAVMAPEFFWRASQSANCRDHEHIIQESEKPLSLHQPVLHNVEGSKLAEGKQEEHQCILRFPSFLLPHGVHRAIAFLQPIETTSNVVVSRSISRHRFQCIRNIFSPRSFCFGSRLRSGRPMDFGPRQVGPPPAS